MPASDDLTFDEVLDALPPKKRFQILSIVANSKGRKIDKKKLLLTIVFVSLPAFIFGIGLCFTIILAPLGILLMGWGGLKILKLTV